MQIIYKQMYEQCIKSKDNFLFNFPMSGYVKLNNKMILFFKIIVLHFIYYLPL